MHDLRDYNDLSARQLTTAIVQTNHNSIAADRLHKTTVLVNDVGVGVSSSFTYTIDLADLKLIGQSQISHSVCFSLTSVCGRKASRSIESASHFWRHVRLLQCRRSRI